MLCMFSSGRQAHNSEVADVSLVSGSSSALYRALRLSFNYRKKYERYLLTANFGSICMGVLLNVEKCAGIIRL